MTRRFRHIPWLLALPALLLAVWWSQNPVAARGSIYALNREWTRRQVLGALSDHRTLSGPRVTVRYLDQDSNVASLVLQTAEEYFSPVVEAVGLQPPGRVEVVLYPDRAALRQAFGWSSSDSAVGVYWAGVIRLLSPNAWLDRQYPARQAAEFRRLGPFAHELVHYLLDYATDGNYPRWFSEGLAQQVEHRLTGYLWLEPEAYRNQAPYTLRHLERDFDRLSNQALAYRQSYLLVKLIATGWGEAALSGVVQDLATGLPFSTALSRRTGLSPAQLEAAWRERQGERREEMGW